MKLHLKQDKFHYCQYMFTGFHTGYSSHHMLLGFDAVQVCVLISLFHRNIQPPSSGKGKGKVHPRTGHEGPEGEQWYNSTLSLTSALDGGRWSTPRPDHSTPRKDPVPSVQGARQARIGLDGCGKSRRHRGSIPGPSSPQRVSIPTGLSRPLHLQE